MDSIENKRKLTTSETASPSLSKMDLKKKKVDVGKAMKKQNDVAMLLAGKVISTVARNTNFVFSPASINAALTMVVSSSKDERVRSLIFSVLRSSSINELKAVFREISTIVLVDDSANGGPKISLLNGVWIEQSLFVEPSLKDLFENFFKATFSQVDFRFKAEQVREEVNSWTSNHTNGLIKEILPRESVKSLTDWIYGNALYFKGAWESKFIKSWTQDKKFHLLNGTSVSVPFMCKSYSKQYIADYDDFKVLKLPFRQSSDINRQFSMYFYLPDANDGLNNLVKRMTSTLGFLDTHIPKEKVDVGEISIPKFKIEFAFEASDAFDELDKLKVYHKACVEIDEDGAEAAAITVVRSFSGKACAKRKISFVADHPFLFSIIEDKTGTVLFVGQIFNPPKSSSSE